MKTKIGIGLILCMVAFSGAAFSQSKGSNNSQNPKQECTQRGCSMKKGHARVHANKKHQRQNGECMRSGNQGAQNQGGGMHQERHGGMNNAFKNK